VGVVSVGVVRVVRVGVLMRSIVIQVPESCVGRRGIRSIVVEIDTRD
jgi:hypothetical protein